jgi:ectoine hydroxylase-related dioxygenase (phytanoyl-CoA dioxygenase family)
VTCWIALTDADEHNGCPWVMPGLHHRGTLAHELGPLGFVCADEHAHARVAAPVRKGGIVVLSSLTPHATGPNLSSSVRKAYIVQLAPDGARAYPADDLSGPGLPCDAPERQFPILVDGDAPERQIPILVDGDAPGT